MRIDHGRSAGRADLARPMDASTAVAGPPRDEAVDALRGFALFGVILVNSPFFAFPLEAGPAVAEPADALAFAVLLWLAVGKFFLMFSFLFGFGFATALGSDRAAGRASGPRLARRLTGLFAFGALHAVFLFVGDILMLYALLGGALWLARDLSPRALGALSAGVYLVAVALQAAALSAPLAPVDTAQAEAAYLGSFLDAARFRLAHDLWLGQGFILIFNGLAALAMFLAGLALARSGAFPGEAGRRGRGPAPVVLLVVGLGLGAAGVVGLGAVDGGGGFAGFAGALALAVAAPPLAVGYGLVVLRAADRWVGRWWVRGLAAAGGMTLTGYLLHSLVLAFVFGGWGLGLYGGVSMAQCLGIGAATWLLIVAGCALWRRRFRYGPDEWLLRSWVDLRAKPFLRRARA